MLEYDEDAERGRGAVTAGAVTGSVPRELVLGVKSNKGDSNGATPYWRAISRPLSNGILQQNDYLRVTEMEMTYHVPWYFP